MQNHCSALDREEEREMLPLCADQGAGVIPWSPVARGDLARGPQGPATKRSEADLFGRLHATMAEADQRVIAAVDQVARARRMPNAHVALAWLLRNPLVTAPIMGATKMERLETAVGALTVTHTSEDVATIEAPSSPAPGGGIPLRGCEAQSGVRRLE